MCMTALYMEEGGDVVTVVKHAAATQLFDMF